MICESLCLNPYIHSSNFFSHKCIFIHVLMLMFRYYFVIHNFIYRHSSQWDIAFYHVYLCVFFTDLPSKPHRFEFSYTLPDYLPPVIHEHEVSTCYYVYATLLQDDSPEPAEPIESLDFYFCVHSTLDIARVPSVLQDGAEFSRLWEFQLRTPLPANSSATTGVVCVRMTLHRRTFLIGGNFIVDVSLWNHLNAPVNCKLKFIRVSITLKSLNYC